MVKKVRSDTLQDFKDFNSQSLTTQAKKGKQFVSMLPVIKEAFDLMDEEIVALSSKNESLENKIGSYDGRWSEESKAKLLKKVDVEIRLI